MPPPFISEYKKYFAVKRICQTFLGPRLFAHPISITVQIIIFTLPAILLSVVHLVDDSPQDLYWRCIVVGVSSILMDVILNFVLIFLKRGHHNVAPSDSLHNFLAEEDQNDYEGFFKGSTWIFIGPNASIVYVQMIAIFCSSLSISLCTPLVYDPLRSPVLRGLGIFTLCIGRYTAVVSQPPEVANFDPIKRLANRFYRPFYTCLVGVAYHGALALCTTAYVDSFYFLWALSLLPILWVFGILPPLDALLPWFFETIVKCFGGIPSYYYFGTVLTIIIGVIGTILSFVAANQNPVLLLVLECTFGYVMSADIGAILNVRSSLCEDVPPKTALIRLLKPTLTILTSICFVILTIVCEITHYYYQGLMAATLTIAISSWIIRQLLIGRKEYASKVVMIFYGVWDGMLMFVLQVWIVIELSLQANKGRSSTVQSLMNLFDYMLTIRAFAQSICSPKMTAWDLTLTSLYRYSSWTSGWSQSSFIVTLFVVSLVRAMVVRFIQFFRFVLVIAHAFLMSPLLDQKWKIALVGLAAYPVSMASLILATVMEGCTLVPIFTLPIFLVGFPRPSSFWKAKWFPKPPASTKQIMGNDAEGKSLDWTIYAQIAPILTRNLVRKAYKARMRLEEGNCFVARYEDRLIFLRVISSGWNFVYVNVRGLEMQEQTSCHHQEAAWMDEYFEKAFGSNQQRYRAYTVRNLLFSSVQPQLPLTVSTYAESKSTLNNLKSKEELQVFQNMFCRAFSYLWIKKNPVFKGESYQRPVASGYHFIPPGGSSVINISDDNEGSYDEKDSDDEIDHRSHHQNGHQHRQNGQQQNNPFSMSKALFNCTMMNVNAIQGNTFGGGGGGHQSTLISPVQMITPNRDAWGFAGGGASNLFPFLPGMDTSVGSVQRGGDFEENSFMNNNTSGMGLNMGRNSNINSFVSESGKDTPDQFDVSKPGSSSWAGLNSLWVKKCVGETIPSNAVKIRVEKLCQKAWRVILGRDEDLLEIDLCQFFKDDFWISARKLTKLSSMGRISIEEITVKAFRYAAKLTLDEIYSGGLESGDSIYNNNNEAKEEEIFHELGLYEKNHKFCTPKDIPIHIDDRQKHIVSMNKTEAGQTQMRLLNFDNFGVEFLVGKVSQFCVDGIWANLNLELLYLTSDDDERFSIQHDRFLMRNISTQCANTPLGYAVYDATYKINLFNNSLQHVT